MRYRIRVIHAYGWSRYLTNSDIFYSIGGRMKVNFEIWESSCRCKAVEFIQALQDKASDKYRYVLVVDDWER